MYINCVKLQWKKEDPKIARENKKKIVGNFVLSNGQWNFVVYANGEMGKFRLEHFCLVFSIGDIEKK
ncbi:Protein lethal(3)malignant blood neoplasm [Trichinella spiralis]|uniref:Protein lethal(3)malignant blood neoplasm n=1 Tax=Trichinella spiralis TaxID=6334 RepID=A0ABR3KP06_TRISP